MPIREGLLLVVGKALASPAQLGFIVRTHGLELTRLLFILALSAPQLAAPAAVHAQADAAKLFGQHCVKCHGADGTGKPARAVEPKIPDFTAASWHTQRSDAQLLVSILDGKGPTMPAFRTKAMISEEQARGLVAHVRAFATTKKKSDQRKPNEPASDDFEKKFRRLQEDFAALQEQFDKLSQASRDGKFASPAGPARPTESKPTAPSESSTPVAARTPAVAKLFQEHCVKCHGADGTGSATRATTPKIPDFTAAAWHTQRSDAQLLVSILDGKGPTMPAWRQKLSEEQARGLVAHVRAFTPTTRKSAPDPDEPMSAEPSEPAPPKGVFEKLLSWLGTFHAPAVHFPIALLTAAAVAQLLHIITGKPAFDTVSRYCIWFGTLTAVAAGVLGWCRAGFRLTDPLWVLTTHRWLGTATVVCALLLLGLSERSRRPDHRRTRLWFRLALLVVAAIVPVTGFFGGAVVFGLDHYSWPP